MKDKKDTYNYKGWLNSDSFIKRCSAIFGYYSLANIIILTIILIIAIIIGTIVGIGSYLIN